MLRAAEDLSLLYSIDGEDVSEGELARLGDIDRINARQLYEVIAELRQRGVIQARCRFRAVLPQAIANTLAAQALERVPPPDFDQFCARLPSRMLKSVSRRLGYLHDSTAARLTVARWLQSDGPFGDLFRGEDIGIQIITNIAPVAPEAVLARLESELVGMATTAPERHQWISLIKAIGYDARLFDRAVTLLARFAAVEPENNNLNSARNIFSEFFHLYLSGAQAPPEQRRLAIKRLAHSGNEDLRREDMRKDVKAELEQMHHCRPALSPRSERMAAPESVSSRFMTCGEAKLWVARASRVLVIASRDHELSDAREF